MEAFTYKGISEGKYVEGDIEAINLDEASHLLKEKKEIITNIIKSKKKKVKAKKYPLPLTLYITLSKNILLKLMVMHWTINSIM